MKISTGDFGYRGTQLGQVHTENPEALAAPQAEKQAAQSTMQAQNIVQQGLQNQSQAVANREKAGLVVGQVLTNTGDEMVQRAQQLARQKAQLQMQDYQDYQQGVVDGINQKLANGEIDSTKVQQAYTDGMKGWQGGDIEDLTGADRTAMQKGMSIADRGAGRKVTAMYEQAQHVELVNAADQFVAGVTQQVLQPGADPTKLRGQIDAYFQRDGVKIYGAQAEAKHAAAVRGLQTGFFQAQIEQHHQDNGTLEQLRGAVVQEVQDPQTRTQLLNSIDSKQSTNTARAAAAQNHADAVATRREVAAVHADDQMNIRIAKGEIPTDDDWKRLEQQTQGTSVAGNIQGQHSAMVATQQVLAMPPAQGQQVIAQRRLELQQHGGSANDYKVLDAAEGAVKQRAADLKNNPQAVAAQDAGVTLAPVSFADGLNAPGQLGAQLQDRLTASNALTKKYGATAGKDLLTTEERSDFKNGYEKLTAEQKVQFWRNTQASAGAEVTRRLSAEVGEGSNITAQVAPLANTPAGYATAAAVTKGEALLNPIDGAPKAKAPKDDDLVAEIKSRYPDMPQSQILASVPLVRAHHVGLGKRDTDIPTDDDLDAVLGAPVKVFGSKIVAPAGLRAEVFTDAMKSSINGLPPVDSASVRNNLDDGIYGFIEDASGNMRLINKTTNRAVTLSDGKPYVVDLSHVR